MTHSLPDWAWLTLLGVATLCACYIVYHMLADMFDE